MTDHVREFDCVDCGMYIVQFGFTDDSKVCATCQWIRDLPNEEDRQRIRAFLAKGREIRDGT